MRLSAIPAQVHWRWPK